MRWPWASTRFCTPLMLWSSHASRKGHFYFPEQVLIPILSGSTRETRTVFLNRRLDGNSILIVLKNLCHCVRVKYKRLVTPSSCWIVLILFVPVAHWLATSRVPWWDFKHMTSRTAGKRARHCATTAPRGTWANNKRTSNGRDYWR